MSQQQPVTITITESDGGQGGHERTAVQRKQSGMYIMGSRDSSFRKHWYLPVFNAS